MPNSATRTAHVLLAGALLASLAACAFPVIPNAEPQREPDMEPTTLTLAEAREITLARQQEIASFFPAELVAETKVAETSRVIYGCGEKDAWQWPSVLRIIIQGEPDHRAIIDAIAAEWGSREGWSVQKGENRLGYPDVRLVHEDRSLFTVGFYKSGSEFWVDSASPCFHHPEGYVPGTEY